MHGHRAGFTLVELMVAIAVLSILLAAAVPSFRELTRNTHVTAAQNDLVTALNLARSEASRTSKPVSVCASTDGVTCATRDDWKSGWIAFTDATGAAGAVDGADDRLLQAWSAVGGNITFQASNSFVRYLPTGTVAPDDAIKTFDLYWDGCAGTHKRHVVISIIGTIESNTLNCS